MSEGRIIYQVSVDTRKIQKQLRSTFSLRFRLAFLLIELAEKVGRIKVDYSIRQLEEKK